MGMFTDYFVATEARATDFVETGPAGHGVPILETKWLEPFVLGSTLWAIIDDASTQPVDLTRHNAAGPWLPSENEAVAVIQISDDFVRVLALLEDERIPAVAAVWATAEEWGGSWEPGELDDTVEGLRDLAREVRLSDQHMYVWICS